MRASHAPGDDQDIISTSRSHTCLEDKPQITSAKGPPAPGVDSDSNERSDSSVKCNNHHNDQSGSEYNTTSDGESDTSGPPGSIEPPVCIGPPHRVGQPKLKVQQHSEVVVADGDISMQSPPHVTHSQCGCAPNVKAIGGFHHSQPAKSSGASRSYGGVIGGKALGNVLNIGNFDSKDVNSQFVDVEGTVNLLPSNTHPTTMDINEAAVIAVTIAFEEALASLLQQVAKYYLHCQTRMSMCTFWIPRKTSGLSKEGSGML